MRIKWQCVIFMAALLPSAIAEAQDYRACTEAVGGLIFCVAPVNQTLKEESTIELGITIRNVSEKAIWVFDLSKIPANRQSDYLTVWAVPKSPPCTPIEKDDIEAKWFTLLQPKKFISCLVKVRCSLSSGEYELGMAIPYRNPCIIKGDKELEAICASNQRWQSAVKVLPVISPIKIRIIRKRGDT